MKRILVVGGIASLLFIFVLVAIQVGGTIDTTVDLYKGQFQSVTYTGIVDVKRHLPIQVNACRMREVAMGIWAAECNRNSTYVQMHMLSHETAEIQVVGWLYVQESKSSPGVKARFQNRYTNYPVKMIGTIYFEIREEGLVILIDAKA